MSKQNIEFKDSGIPWIGQIPKHWEVTKIKYCLKENFSGCWGDDLENEQISQNSRLCIRVADFDFDRQKVKQTADTFRNYTKSQILSTKLQDGDLIIEKSGGGDKMPVGRSVVFEQNLFGEKEVLFANFCQCFRPLNINNKFFAHAMKAFYQNNNMRFFFNQTTGIQNLSIFNILNAFLPYPPLNEQKEIAEFLDKKCEIIDKRLSNLERKIKSLKEYKKSLISECVTKGLNPKNIEFKDSGIPWIGQIPKHWEIKKVKYCFYIISGSGFEIKSQGLESGDYPVVKASDISKAGHYLYTSSNYINSKEQKNLGFKIIPKGSILMAKIGEAMKKNNRSIAMVDCCLDNNCQGLVPKDIKSDFAFYLFNCINSQWFDNSGTIPCINNVKLLNFKIPYPSIDEQKKIAEFLDKKCEKIDRLNENYTKQITALKEYKKSLIYECVTGKNI